MITLPPPHTPSTNFRDNSSLAPLMLEYHWNGTNCDFFPLNFKLVEPFIQGVLRQFSSEERILLQDYFQIPWEWESGTSLMDKLKNLRLEEEAKTVFRFLKKLSGDDSSSDRDSDNDTVDEPESVEKVPPTGITLDIPEFQENLDIATRLYILYQSNLARIPALPPFHWKQENHVWDNDDSATKDEKNYSQALHCLYELLALCQEAEMEGSPHPLVGNAKKFTKRQDYCRLLMVYACHESSISGYQLHYLEQLCRQFHLSHHWYLETLTSCLTMDNKERMSAVLEQYAVFDGEIHSILLEDAITLDLLSDPKKVKADKVNLPRYMCKNQKQRNEQIEQIKNKRLGATL